MKKITCSVINDLLPLYADNALSSDSRLIVEEHLEECQKCSESLKMMKSPTIIVKNSDKEKIKMLERSVSRRRFAVTSLIMVIVTAGLVFFGLLWEKMDFDNMSGAKGALINYFVISYMCLMLFASVWYWSVYGVVMIRRVSAKSVKRVCTVSAYTMAAVYIAVTAGFFLLYYGAASKYDNVELQTEFQYSETSLLNQEWVIHINSKNKKAINVFREEKYDDDHNASGIVYYVREVPIKAVLESDNYTVGYSYGDVQSTPPKNDYDFTVTIVFSDKTVVYSMRGEGLFEKQKDVVSFN